VDTGSPGHALKNLDVHEVKRTSLRCAAAESNCTTRSQP